jgi:ADP-ribosyl-[dinitrogen reductase] hydrolase
MFFFPDHQAVVRFSGESSKTTHGATECIDACRLFGSMLLKALRGQSKEEILFEDPFPWWSEPPLSDRIQAIADGDYRRTPERDIRGSGYVVESLEAALWCFYHTLSFQDAVLRAVNLGDDADTTGAVCGQIAGAFYGKSQIPERWVQQLANRDLIEGLAVGLYE